MEPVAERRHPIAEPGVLPSRVSTTVGFSLNAEAAGSARNKTPETAATTAIHPKMMASNPVSKEAQPN